MQIHYDARTAPRLSFSKGPELPPLGVRMTLAVAAKQPTRRRRGWIPRDRSGSRERVCRRCRVLDGTYRSKGRSLAISRRPSELYHPLSAGMIRWLGSIAPSPIFRRRQVRRCTRSHRTGQLTRRQRRILPRPRDGAAGWAFYRGRRFEAARRPMTPKFVGWPAFDQPSASPLIRESTDPVALAGYSTEFGSNQARLATHDRDFCRDAPTTLAFPAGRVRNINFRGIGTVQLFGRPQETPISKPHLPGIKPPRMRHLLYLSPPSLPQNLNRNVSRANRS